MQFEVAKRLSASDVRVSGWKETDTCMLKLVFDLPQLKKLSILLKEYSSEDSARRAMYLLFETTFNSTDEHYVTTSSKDTKGISVAELKLREREQTIQELRRRITILERTVESRPAPEAPALPRKIPLIPKGASLTNPSKRRRVVKDMRFDDE
ncbi:hypothetical protein RhiJN_07374 [Ceratobasidium sp. AG-Ba]|nr:hypothetical protein RhiJN_07374 [Ceratobasidium sp. AG-Ba]QRW08228.1 hypothetical protein RhiLY_07227 [Ceratobasidium sp. AG-Ba]